MNVSASCDPRHRKVVRAETTSNTVVTAVLAIVISWLIFRGRTAIPLLGSASDGLFGIIPGTFNFTLLVTLALTLVIRRRVARGQQPRATGGAARYRFLPGNVVLRALTMALLLTLTLVPLVYSCSSFLVHRGLVAAQWSVTALVMFYEVYFVVLALIVTPVVVWRALSD